MQGDMSQKMFVQLMPSLYECHQVSTQVLRDVLQLATAYKLDAVLKMVRGNLFTPCQHLCMEASAYHTTSVDALPCSHQSLLSDLPCEKPLPGAPPHHKNQALHAKQWALCELHLEGFCTETHHEEGW